MKSIFLDFIFATYRKWLGRTHGQWQ